MALIQINNLNSIGSDLFADPENYLEELSEPELHVYGGGVKTSTRLETLETSFLY